MQDAGQWRARLGLPCSMTKSRAEAKCHHLQRSRELVREGQPVDGRARSAALRHVTRCSVAVSRTGRCERQPRCLQRPQPGAREG
eukprot:10429698-Alexandrium_andersonii.AAC.1